MESPRHTSADTRREAPPSGLIQHLDSLPGVNGFRVALLATQLAACTSIPERHNRLDLLSDAPTPIREALEAHDVPNAINDICDISYDPDRVQYPTLHLRQIHGQPNRPIDDFREMIQEHGLDPDAYLRGVQESQEAIHEILSRLYDLAGEPIPVYFEGELEMSPAQFSRKREELAELEENLAAIPHQPAGIEQLNDLWSTLKEHPSFTDGRLVDPTPVRTTELVYEKVKELSRTVGRDEYYLSATQRRLLDDLRTDFVGPEAPFSRYLLNSTEKAYYNHSGAYAAFMSGQADMLPGDSYPLLARVVEATNQPTPNWPRYGSEEEIRAYHDKLQEMQWAYREAQEARDAWLIEQVARDELPFSVVVYGGSHTFDGNFVACTPKTAVRPSDFY